MHGVCSRKAPSIPRFSISRRADAKANYEFYESFQLASAIPAEVFFVSVILAVVIPHDRGRSQQF
jgi:hypothetical protein